MKKVTTIAILLCSIVVYGQKGTLKLDSISKFGTSTVWALRDTYTMAPPKIQGYYFQLSNTKTVIRANYPDSTGLVKVWLNRKEIRWTSDSTFTYKTEQK